MRLNMPRCTRADHGISIPCGPARYRTSRWGRTFRIGHSPPAASLASRDHSYNLWFTRLPREIPLTWGIFVREQTLRSGGASRTAPPGHSSPHLRWTSTTHHPSVSLARLLSLFLSALPMNRCRPPAITTAEQKVVRTSDYREDLDPENARLKTVRRPK
jgi:hypothetical protein